MKRPRRLTRRQIAELRRQGFAPNEQALQHLMDGARDRRIRALTSRGISPNKAKAQVSREFAEYDVIEFHASGWVRIFGMNFYPEANSSS